MLSGALCKKGSWVQDAGHREALALNDPRRYAKYPTVNGSGGKKSNMSTRRKDVLGEVKKKEKKAGNRTNSKGGGKL